MAGLEPLAIAVYEGDEAGRHAKVRRNERRDVVELGVGPGVEQSGLVERTLPCVLVGGAGRALHAVIARLRRGEIQRRDGTGARGLPRRLACTKLVP
jgi:hypothetical protein